MISNTTNVNSTNCEKTRHKISLLSWNINDVKMKNEGLKTKSIDFAKALKGHHIIGLQETKKPVKVANYRCHNSNRKIQDLVVSAYVFTTTYLRVFL